MTAGEPTIESPNVWGIAAMVVGHADLAVAYGANDLNALRVVEAVNRVIAVANTYRVPAASFAPMVSARGLFGGGIMMLAVAREHKPVQDFFLNSTSSAVKS